MSGSFFIRIARKGTSLTAGLLLAVFSALGQKNDTIYLNDGDRITGELKKLEYGLVTLKTDAMQTVYISLDKIYTAYSSKQFEFRTTSGFRYFGSILNSEVPGTIFVLIENDTIPKPLWDIVQITSIKDRFWQKIDGSVDMGLSYTKASDVFQFSLNATVTYRTQNYSTRLDLSNILSSDNENEFSTNRNLGLNVTRYLPGKWSASVQTNGQQNTELDLDYRILFGFAGGYDLVRNNSQRLYAISGLMANRERTIETSATSNNLELLTGIHYKWFRYNQPKIDITAGFDIFPSLTSGGRVRMEFDLNSRVEVLKDVFLSLTVYDSFDNNTSSGGTSKNDWGVITSLGYSF